MSATETVIREAPPEKRRKVRHIYMRGSRVAFCGAVRDVPSRNPVTAVTADHCVVCLDMAPGPFKWALRP